MLSTHRALLVAAAAAAGLAVACSSEAAEPAEPATSIAPAPATEPVGPPNVLFIVWDTTRADHTSVHGYAKETTPFLKKWAEGARVFDDCISTGSSTVPSHGSMFTGKLPSEHGANNSHNCLEDQHVTLAEIFRDAGYRTYCFAANPHISEDENFVQGFELAEHPWDDRHCEQAFAIIESKINPADKSSELATKILRQAPGTWDLKAAGELAGQSLVEWLGAHEPGKPFFAFLNYMEAHRPFIPREEHRRRFMSEQQVEASYKADRSWETMWAYTLGMHEYAPEELEVMALTYDACVYELDRLLEDLIGTLQSRGWLENTVVVLTGDHGEHLGEHHMLDHQYSLYQGLVHVPMVLWYPPKVAPGRVDLPVQNYDVFPTLLELAGLPSPPGLQSRAVSLLAPQEKRQRIAEYPSVFANGINSVKSAYRHGFDAAPFNRTLRALYDKRLKLIWGSDGRHELYNLRSDPNELTDLAAQRVDRLHAAEAALEAIVLAFVPFAPSDEPSCDPRLLRKPCAHLGHEQDMRMMLKELGYAGDDEEVDPEAEQASEREDEPAPENGKPPQ